MKGWRKLLYMKIIYLRKNNEIWDYIGRTMNIRNMKYWKKKSITSSWQDQPIHPTTCLCHSAFIRMNLHALHLYVIELTMKCSKKVLSSLDEWNKNLHFYTNPYVLMFQMDTSGFMIIMAYRVKWIICYYKNLMIQCRLIFWIFVFFYQMYWAYSLWFWSS